MRRRAAMTYDFAIVGGGSASTASFHRHVRAAA